MSELTEIYHRDGYIVLEQLVSQSGLDEIESQLSQTISGDRSGFEEFDIFYEKDTDKLRQIENLQKYGDFWQELTLDKRWLDPVEQIFEAEAVLVNCSYMAKSAKVGSLVPFHQDNAYYFYVPDHALTVWLALDDSDEENGCVRVIPGSHKKGIVPHAPSGVMGSSQGLAEDLDPQAAGEVSVSLKRGDASLHHCCTIHRSRPNRSDRQRRGVLFFYRSVNAMIDEDRARKFAEELRELVDSQKK